jgi:hypothetical protein
MAYHSTVHDVRTLLAASSGGSSIRSRGSLGKRGLGEIERRFEHEGLE